MEKLNELYKIDWDFEILDNPEASSQYGFHEKLDRPYPLQDVSPKGYASRLSHHKSMVDQVTKILNEEGTNIPENHLVFAELFKHGHEEIVDNMTNYPIYVMPLNSIGAGGITFSFLESIEWMRFESLNDFNLLIERMRGFKIQSEQFIESMKEGIKIGYVANDAMTYNIEKDLKSILNDGYPEINQVFILLNDISSDVMNEKVKEKIQLEINEAKDIVSQGFQLMLDFYENEYKSNVRSKDGNIGCSSLPNGVACYDACLRYHTTTNLTANQVHEIGLEEVERIKNRYINDVLLPLGWKENQLEEFIHYCRNNKEFYKDTPNALLQVYYKMVDDIYKIMPNYFNESPRNSMEIVSKERGPCAFYLAGTSDGKRPGKFYVNISNLSGKPIYESAALSLHEGVPGHHHQLSLASENEKLPPFLRYIEDRRYEVCPCRRQLYTSYAEGWALYCEYLGEEMNMYTDSYSLFGRLSMEMMRAVRLVVDTGIHSKGWSIEESIKYMMTETGMHRNEVEKEIKRYASWPGQACAYKLGELEIRRLRNLAQSKLGSKFDIKKFHSICLMHGPLPLVLLEKLILKYIENTI